jgi:hypothetical protein
MTKDEALEKALEALERYQVKRQDFDRFADEITAIKQALAAPVQGPSCPECVFGLCHCGLRDTPPAAPVQEPVTQDVQEKCRIEVVPAKGGLLPAAQRQWVGLTDEEKETLSYEADGNTWAAVELAEAKLKEKNNG